MRTPILALLLGVPVVLALSCFTGSDPLYCQDNSDCNGSRPLCDLTGELPGSGGLGNTCVATSGCDNSSDCDASAPICDGSGQCQPCDAVDGDSSCALLSEAAPVCDPTGQCVACVTSADCGDPAEPICIDSLCVPCGDAGDDACAEKDPAANVCSMSGPTAGRCVECATGEECTSAEAPVCGPDGLCTGCSEHTDCPSEVCDRQSGQCVDAGNVFYLATSGNGGGDDGACGTPGDPCETIDYVIDTRLDTSGAPDRTWLKLGIGTFSSGSGQRVDIQSGLSVQLVGSGTDDTRINSDSTAPTVSIDSAGTVLIDSLRIQNGLEGVECRDSTGLVVLEAEIGGNDGIGLDSDSCDLMVSRSKIITNTGGGILATDSPIEITNTLIINNGTDVSSQGGVVLTGSTSGVFSFNTVAINKRGLGGGVAAGVECAQMMPVSASSNIVWGNDKTDQLMNEQVDGAAMCAWTYSDIEQDVTGDGNINVEPSFRDTGAPRDYRLTATGNDMLEGAADPNATLGYDFDGDLRPQGTGRDIGADEIAE